MIEAKGIKKTFTARGGLLSRAVVRAVRGVDVTIPDAGAVSLIGESGCGKTTLGRILSGLETWDEGQLVCDGQDLSALTVKDRQPYFRKIQLIQQDPYSALNPARTIYSTLADPLQLVANRSGRGPAWVKSRAEELLHLVGLDAASFYKYPHQLSGGQRQRMVIARALTVEPTVLVADEAVSMIDVSLRLGILSLLKDLRKRLRIALLFITHDVAAARYIGQDGHMYVIYRGEVIENGATDTVIQNPVHPYTQALLSALPVLRGLEVPGRDRYVPLQAIEQSGQDESGCLFHQRCPYATDRCRVEHPVLTGEGGVDGQAHACFYPTVRHVVAEPLTPPGA